MAKVSAQPIRDARDFLTLRSIPGVSSEALKTWMAEKRPTTLLRASLEARSDFGFIEGLGAEMAHSLEAEGVIPSLSSSLLPIVLASPGMAVSKREEGREHVRQSVVVERSEAVELPFELYVKIDVWIRPKHTPINEKRVVPPEVDKFEVTCSVLDLEQEDDTARLYGSYIEDIGRFGPQKSARTLSRSVAFLGDPRALGGMQVPSEWRDEFTVMSRAFGVNAEFQTGPNFAGMTADKVDHVFRFEPYAGSEPKTHSGRVIDQTKIDARSTYYSSMLYQIGGVLLDLENAEEVSVSSPRALELGEQVFHRKIGKSGPYDRFDGGSATPCTHGRGSFIRFYNSDKAVKGFRRRYTNFEDNWMHHCSKYPNCNVYAVFRPGEK